MFRKKATLDFKPLEPLVSSRDFYGNQNRTLDGTSGAAPVHATGVVGVIVPGPDAGNVFLSNDSSFVISIFATIYYSGMKVPVRWISFPKC